MQAGCCLLIVPDIRMMCFFADECVSENVGDFPVDEMRLAIC